MLLIPAQGLFITASLALLVAVEGFSGRPPNSVERPRTRAEECQLARLRVLPNWKHCRAGVHLSWCLWSCLSLVAGEGCQCEGWMLPTVKLFWGTQSSMHWSSPIATAFCSFKTGPGLVCVWIKFLQNIPVSFSSVFTSTPKIPHTSACFTRNSDLLSELRTGTSQDILPPNLSFIWRPCNKADCLEHSLSSVSSQGVQQSNSIHFICNLHSRHACTSCNALRWQNFACIWNHCSWHLDRGWGETFIREKDNETRC